MTRFASFSAIGIALVSLTACSSSGGGDENPTMAYKVKSSQCAPGDPTCTPCDPTDTACGQDPKVPPCDPSSTNCDPQKDPKVPPCDPSSTNCDPPCDPNDPTCKTDPCAAQSVKADPSCTNFLGFAWNGSDCVELQGCQCVGSDCGLLFKTAADCKAKFAGCSTPSFCEKTAEELATLLASARSCNIAAGAPMVCDGSFVPGVAGCPVPVASAGSKATLAYLDLYSIYAKQCPLPVPACPDPKGLAVDCVQGPGVDGFVGECSVVSAKNPGAAQ